MNAKFSSVLVNPPKRRVSSSGDISVIRSRGVSGAAASGTGEGVGLCRCALRVPRLGMAPPGSLRLPGALVVGASGPCIRTGTKGVLCALGG
jgi:hypothetical protein